MNKINILKTVAVIATFALLNPISTFAVAKKKSSNVAPFKMGSSCLGISMGLGVSYHYYGNANQSPALAITYDRAVKEDVGPGTIGLGAIVAYKSASYRYSYGNYRARWSNYVVGGRCTYHFNVFEDDIPELDLYAGLTLGLRFWSYTDTYYDDYGTNPYNYGSAYIFAGGFAGAKYNFSKKMGAFAELGYDISYLRLGINFNFQAKKK
jgi:hypothetical protein